MLTTLPARRSRPRRARSLERLGVTPVLDRTVIGIDAESVTLQAPDGVDRADPDAAPSSGPPASPPPASPQRSASWPAPRSTAPAGDRRARPHAPGPSRGARARRHGPRPRRRRRGRRAARRGAGGDAAGPLRGARWSAPGCAAATRRPSATATRATSPRSAAPAPSPTSGVAASAARWPGSPGCVVHLCYLIGFQNRLLVLIRWSFSFVTPRPRRPAHHRPGGERASRPAPRRQAARPNLGGGRGASSTPPAPRGRRSGARRRDAIDELRGPGLIGAPGFEPGTSPTRTARATRLRHAPSRLSRLQPFTADGLK